MSSFFKIFGILIISFLGAIAFNLFAVYYLLTNPYFENIKFIKDFKQGKIIVSQKEQVYIQENVAIEEAIQRVEKSIVAIQSEKLELKSGLIVTFDGLVVTLAGAIPKDGKFNIFAMGEKAGSEVVKIDTENNIALIKINKNSLPTIGFADSEKIKLGESVFLVTSTSIEQNSWLANVGVIREINKNTIKTSIIEKPLAEGSPLFNVKGELVGLSFIDQEGKISAVSTKSIKEFLGL